jgi:hypothetical protein
MATFETTIGNPSREFMARITTTDAIPVVYEDVNIGSIEHIGSLVSGSAFEIGTAIAGRVTIEIVNNDGEYTGHTFENKEFKVEIGLNVDGTYVYKILGYFKVESARAEEDETITLKCVDRMYLFNKDYVSALTYPQTLMEILIDACSQAGVVLATESFVNDDYSVSVEPSYYGIQIRKMIAQIAELAGGYATINIDGELEIINLSTAIPREITDENYVLNVIDKVGNALIDNLTVAVGDYSLSASSGTNVYTIANNMFVYDPADVINPIFTVLNGLTFTPCRLEWQGDFSLPIGQYMEVSNDDETFYMFALNRVIKYDGGLTETTISPALSDVVKNAQISGAIRLDVNRIITEIEVMEGQIALKVDQSVVDDLGREISEAQTELIVQAEQIATKVSTTEMEEALTQYTTITQTDSKVEIAVGEIQTQIDDQATTIDDVRSTFTFGSALVMGKTGSPFTVSISNTSMEFIDSGTVVAYINGQKMMITEADIEMLSFAYHKAYKHTNGETTLIVWEG